MISMSNVRTIPSGLLLHAGMQPTFVATFALFCGVLLLWTIVVGKILKKTLRLPVIAGRILAGIALGPSLIDIASWPIFDSALMLPDYASGHLYSVFTIDLIIFLITVFSSAITVSYLMWVAGHETDLRDIASIGFTAVSAGFLGAIVPIISVAGALYYGLGGMWDLLQSLSIGIIFAATSVSIPVAMLFERKKMHLRSSKATLGAAVVDDIIAVVIVSLFFLMVQTGALGSYSISFASGHHHTSIWSALGAMVATFIGLMLFGYAVVPNFLRWMKSAHMVHLFPVVGTAFMLLYFACAELLGGLAGITGAYFAGLFHRMGDSRHSAEKVFSPFVNKILLPIFLGSIGLTLNMKVLSVFDWVIVVGLLVVAIISKLVSCYISTGATNKWYGLQKDRWTSLESFLFGASMVARGEVGLVIATIMYGSGFILMHQYVVSVVVIVLTTVAAPMLLAYGFAKMEARQTDQEGTYALDIGMFPVIGTTQMFHIIMGHLQQSGLYSTTVQMSESRKIVSLDGENVELILCSQEGILFKGDERKIKEILAMIKQLVVHEVDRLSA